MGSDASALDATFPAPLEHPVFQAALEDLAAVDVQMSAAAAPGAQPYAVIGARSNARWWLVPLETGRLANSGLALFQPVSTSAQWIKALASCVSRAGLQHLWARRKVYLSIGPELARLAGRRDIEKFAFFTGTDSPHRKVAVQMMDSRGAIHAFAKVTRNPEVAALLKHEAAVLQRLESARLRSIAIPRVLWADRVANATVLVTDTLKTPASRSPTEFTPAHQEFVRELAQRSAGPKRSLQEIGAEFRSRIEHCRNRMSAPWRERLLRAAACFAGPALVETSLAHGDFTPWNSFVCERGLYVFDWEYAADGSLPGHDAAHFVLNASDTRLLAAGAQHERARQQVKQACPDLDASIVDLCLVAYMVSLCLRFIERAHVVGNAAGATWERERECARLLDYALSERSGALP